MNSKYTLLIASFLAYILPATAQTSATNDSITIAAHPEYNKGGGLRHLTLGKNYRTLWAATVKMKVFHLQTEKGGLKITGEGGGNQTNSLQFVDSTGQEWVLRSVQKVVARSLPKYYHGTIVTDFLQDEVSTQHPYAPLCVPPLATALDIPHANPLLYYLPDDPALGKYREKYANQVYFFENHSLPGDKKELKTEKLQSKLEKDNDTKADQLAVLRARLLDMVIGDWDRHEDQWRWRKEDDTTKDTYQPIPRDRDKVFYTTDGIVPHFAAMGSPKLLPFKGRIKNIGGWNSNAVPFDLYFLNQLNSDDCRKEITYVQSKLTDSLITASVKLMPANIYALSGQHITQILIQRRNNLMNDGLEYYKFLSETVDIPASDKNEHFTIAEMDNGQVAITINKIKNDNIGKAIYQRAFNPDTTKEIRLYGLDGKNSFDVSGKTPSPIKVRMIGGNDVDTYHIDSLLDNKHKLFVYDRSDEKNNLPSHSQALINTSTDSTINKFDHPVHQSNHFSPLISLGYSPEDGVLLIAGFNSVKHGFKEDPYAAKQQLKVSFTLAKESFIVSYKGDFKKVIGNSDLQVNILERGPKNVSNFFGLGNIGEFVDAGDKTFDYYRNRYDFATADVRIAHQYGKWQLNAGPIAQYYSSWASNNGTHFFKEYDQAHPELQLFGTKYYAGLVGASIYDTRDNDKFTTKGVIWKTTITGLSGLNVPDHTNGAILSTFCFYLPVKDSAFVIADRIGAGTTLGKGEFFQMMNLGGASLQGYHTSRFIGNSMVYNNLEVRLKVCDFNAYLFPSALGFIGYNGTDRFWLNGESSSTVHKAYGGGIYLTPYHSFIFEAVAGEGTEGWLTYYSIGFRF